MHTILHKDHELSARRTVKMETENRFSGGTVGNTNEKNQRKIAARILELLLVSAQIRGVRKKLDYCQKETFVKRKKF